MNLRIADYGRWVETSIIALKNEKMISNSYGYIHDIKSAYLKTFSSVLSAKHSAQAWINSERLI